MQIAVPFGLRRKVMELGHSQPLSGHLGIEKSRKRILHCFWWPGCLKDIKLFCEQCDECQKVAKRANIRAPLVTTPIIQEPFRKIAMDIIGPLKRSKNGYKYILTIIDEATRYPEAYPLRSIESEKS